MALLNATDLLSTKEQNSAILEVNCSRNSLYLFSACVIRLRIELTSRNSALDSLSFLCPLALDTKVSN